MRILWVSKLPEDEVREIIRKYYDTTGTHEDSMQAVMNYIREKEPEWKMKYFNEEESVGRVTNILNNLDLIYQDYKKYAPMRLNDKYKHALLNCRAAQRGQTGEDLVTLLSRLKEFSDVYITKNNTPQESFEDTQANTFGRSLGKFNKDGNCEEMVQKRYKRNF